MTMKGKPSDIRSCRCLRAALAFKPGLAFKPRLSASSHPAWFLASGFTERDGRRAVVTVGEPCPLLRAASAIRPVKRAQWLTGRRTPCKTVCLHSVLRLFMAQVVGYTRRCSSQMN